MFSSNIWNMAYHENFDSWKLKLCVLVNEKSLLYCTFTIKRRCIGPPSGILYLNFWEIFWCPLLEQRSEVQMINVLPHIISPNLIRMKKIWKDLNTEYFEKLIYFYAALAMFSANETWGAKPSQNHPPPFQNKKRLASWFSGRRLKMWGRWGPMGTIKTVCCKRYGYARDIGDARDGNDLHS